MNLATLMAALDQRIDRLQRVRALLQTEPSKRGRGRPKKVASSSVGGIAPGKRGPGRPRSSGKVKAPASKKESVKSAERRTRMRGAQKARSI